MPPHPPPLTYAAAGVKLEEKDRFTDSLVSIMRRTHSVATRICDRSLVRERPNLALICNAVCMGPGLRLRRNRDDSEWGEGERCGDPPIFIRHPRACPGDP